MESFEAMIAEARGGGAYVQVPAAVLAALGGRGRIPVPATFDGLDHRGSVVTMDGVRCIGVLKEIRTTLSKGPGDTFAVMLTADTDERTVEVPFDLPAALAAAGTTAAFADLSYSHRGEYVEWIEDAKKAATQGRRIGDTVTRVTADG